MRRSLSILVTAHLDFVTLARIVAHKPECPCYNFCSKCVNQQNMIEQISTLIEQRTGLSVATRFQADFQAILNQIAGDDLAGFYQTLQHSSHSAPGWQALVRALTIGETYFFRDADTFHLLRDQVLLPLIQQRRAERRLELSVWCAGCATGEEPYSVAMSLVDLLPDLDRWRIHLLGTDINATALEHARAGIYRDWAFRHCPADVRKRHFTPVSTGWVIKPALREMVNFRLVNLFDLPTLPAFDLIFCRNVLIYLTRGQAAALETNLHSILAPGGWLLLGPSEALRAHRERWITHVFSGAVFYQKPVKAQTGPVTRRHEAGHKPAEATIANGQPPVDLYAAAVTAVHNDQPHEAERLLAELLAERPNDARAHTLLAYIFGNRSALPEAHTHLDTALRCDTMLSDAHYLRAALFLEAGQTEQAEQALRAALYCCRDHLLATFLLGNLYAQSGDLVRANRAWSAARVQVNTLSPEARVSDLSDLTAAAFHTLIESQLDHRGDSKA